MADLASVKTSLYLPPEILDLIAQHLFDTSEIDDHHINKSHPDRTRQRDLYSFCLVSRAWYQAGIAHLYGCPELTTDQDVIQFASTVSSTARARQARSNDLASMVTTLDMNWTAYCRSNGLRRLVDAVNASLIRFVAPSMGFGSSSLAALSRCQKLQYIDVSSLSGRPFRFPMFKKTISELHKLEALALPRNMKLTITDSSAGEWPPQLQQLSIGGLLDSRVLRTFDWPPALTGLTFDCLSDLYGETLEIALCSQETLRTSLKSLHVHWNIPDFHFDSDMTDLLYRLPNLVFLRTSANFTGWMWTDTPPPGSTGLPLRTMELTGEWPWHDDTGYMINWLLREACNYLPNLRALGIPSSVRDAMKDLT